MRNCARNRWTSSWLMLLGCNPLFAFFGFFGFSTRKQLIMAKWGGKRAGSGRPMGSNNRAVPDHALEKISRRAAASSLGVSVVVLDRVIAAGLLETTHTGSRVLITSASVRKLVGSDRAILKALYGQRGGKRVAGPGKKIGRPHGCTKLRRQAAALASIVPKTPRAGDPQSGCS